MVPRFSPYRPRLAFMLLLTAAACGSARNTSGGSGRSGSSTAMAIVYAEDLADASAGATLAEVLRNRVPNLRIERSRRGSSCPQVVIRGIKSIVLSSAAEIYLDGVKLGDGCILDTLAPREVALIEVYSGSQVPRGAAPSSHAGGVILIFTRH